MPRERLYRTEGVVLRQMDYAEADRILTLVTPRGRLSAIAKGIQRPTSRKAGHLGLFTRTNLLVAAGRNLDIITQAEAIEVFQALHADLLRFTYACYAGELVERFAQEDDDDGGALYELLLWLLRWLECERDLALGARFFESRLLRIVGYQPELFTCLRCGEAIRPVVNHFSVAQGGLLCDRCGPQVTGTTPVSVNAQKVLRYLQTHQTQDICALRLQRATHAEVEKLLLGYIEHVLEREVKSATFLHRLREDLQRLERSAAPQGQATSPPSDVQASAAHSS